MADQDGRLPGLPELELDVILDVIRHVFVGNPFHDDPGLDLDGCRSLVPGHVERACPRVDLDLGQTLGGKGQGLDGLETEDRKGRQGQGANKQTCLFHGHLHH